MRNAGTGRNSWWAQALHNRLIALVLAMVVIVPLVAVPADVRVGGTAAMVLQGFALLLAVTLLWRSRFDISRERVLAFVRTGANLPVLLLVALALVSCLVSPNKAFGVQGVLELGAGVLLYFVVAYQFRQSKHLSMLVDTLLFLAAAVSIAEMGQYTMDPGARATVLFGNQQPLGSLLMILLPIVAVVAVADKSRNRQLVAQIVTVMTAGSLMLAHTLSAWLGAAAGLAVLAALVAYSASQNRKAAPATQRSMGAQKHKIVMPLVLAIVTLGFFGLMTTQSSGIAERGARLANVSGVKSWNARLDLWKGTVNMIAAGPVLGYGINSYALNQREFTGQGAAIVENGANRVTLGENAHSFYLQLAAELGLPGLALMLAVMGSFMVTAFKGLKQMDAGIRRTLLMGSMAAMVAFSIDALSNPSWQFGQVSMFFWLMMGVGTSCFRPRAKHEEEVPAVAFSPRVVRPLAVVAVALVMSMVVLPTASIAAGSTNDYRDGTPGAVRIAALIAAGVAGYGLINALFRTSNPGGGNGGRGNNSGGNNNGTGNNPNNRDDTETGVVVAPGAETVVVPVPGTGAAPTGQ